MRKTLVSMSEVVTESIKNIGDEDENGMTFGQRIRSFSIVKLVNRKDSTVRKELHQLASKFEDEEEREVSIAEKNEQLQKLSEEFEGDENDDKKDPVTPYGPGVLSYFSLIEQLLQTFTIIAVLAIPIIVVFYRNGGMNYMHPRSYTQITSFGNMGFDTSVCMKDIINPASVNIDLFL